jgi:molybdopterin converting factor small subunit
LRSGTAKIRVRCFTGMRRYAPGGKGDFEMAVEEGSRVEALLDRLGVSSDERPFVAVNGTRAEDDHPLNDGDTIVLFTPADGG